MLHLTGAIRRQFAGLVAVMVFLPSLGSAAVFTPPPHSKGVGILLAAALDAVKAGDNKTALQRIHEAQGIKNRNAYDDYRINDLLGIVALNLHDDATAEAAYDAAAGSTAVPDSEKSNSINGAIHMAYVLKKYDIAVQYGQTGAANNYLCCKNALWLAMSHFNLKNYEKAALFAQLQISSSRLDGKQPDETVYQVLFASLYSLHDLPGAKAALEVLVNDYKDQNYAGALAKLSVPPAGGQ